MAPQTSYSVEHAAAYQGGRADSGLLDALTGRNTDAGVIPFGCAVAYGTANALLSPRDYVPMKLPAGSTDKILGVLIHDMAHEASYPFGTSSPTGVAVGDLGSIAQKGRVYVPCEQNVTPADPVFVRYAAGAGGSQLGAFRKDADTATAVALSGAKFAGETVSGLVAIDLNLP